MTLPAAEWIPLADLLPWKRNPRLNDGRPVRVVADSIRRFGFADPVVAWREKRQIVGGHTRIKAMQAILADDATFVPRGCPSPGMVPVRFMDFASQAEADACAVALNKAGEAATWDDGALADILHDIEEADASLLDAIGFEDDELAALLGDPGDAGGSGDDRRDGPNLAERFGVPPFSVLDARQGYWQDRKRAWLGIGIQSELGRGAAETGIPGGARLPAATLDPSGKTQRGDGRGRVAGGGAGNDRRPSEGPHMGSVGGDVPPDVQSLPRRGEGKSRRTTWVAGNRPESALDDTSRKILGATKSRRK